MSQSDFLVYQRTQGDYTIKCTHKVHPPCIAQYVAQKYYTKFKFNVSYNDLLAQIVAEDELYKDISLVYTIYDNRNDIMATAKMIRSFGDMLLPIEKVFNIDLTELAYKMAPAGQIWEVARLSAQGNNVEILKLLLKEGIYNCSSKDDIITACIDRRVLYRLRMLGIPFVELGEAKLYLGSITCPAAYNIRDLAWEFSYDELHKDDNYVRLNKKTTAQY